MSYLEEKDKEYLMNILSEIGTWADEIEEHYYKDGEEIPTPEDDEDNDVSQKTIYYEDGEKKYEINSNGKETQIIEYENDEVVESFMLDEDEMLEILGVA